MSIWQLFWLAWMAYWVVFLTTKADGAELRLLELDRFTFEAYKIADHRDGYLPYPNERSADGREAWRGGTAVRFDLDLASWRNNGLYWRNRVHGEGTNVQFREVGWNYELGLRLGKVEIFWDHHSRHWLEGRSKERFPLDNFYGGRVTFFERKRK